MTDPSPDYLDVLGGRGLLPADTVAAMLVGSTARGWGNSRSDHDIYVVCAEAPAGEHDTASVPLDPPEVWATAFDSHGRFWEVTYWLECQVDQMLQKVSWTQFEHDVKPGVLAPREEVFLGRLPTCVPLAGQPRIESWRATLDESAFRALCLSRSLAAADNAVEDALGQLDGGDLHSAVLSARKAFGHAVDALLEERGEYGSLWEKWRPQRFRAARPAVLSFEAYWRLETMQTFDPDAPADWVHDILTLCQDISMKVEI